MARPVSDITIVGGGSTGWLAAAYLAAMYQPAVAAGKLRLHLIESARIPPIGVGEALSPTMPDLLQAIGVRETEFFRRTQATFKLGGFFLNWDRDESGAPLTWANPFGVYERIGADNIGYYYQAFGGRTNGADTLSFDQATTPSADLIALGHGPRPLGAPDYQTQFRYAYHMDAKAFAEMLREQATARGVRHIVDDVTGVNLDQRGYVASLDLEQAGRRPVELVIDATGFRGLIIRGALDEPFADYGDRLANDRAAVMQIPRPDGQAIEPATRATALNAGWSFRVPLFNRSGAGYVYSSRHISDEDAVRELKAFLGDDAPEGAEPRVIKWRVGKTRRTWVKNCIAMGLSAGFVEPLEATAIFSVEKALNWLSLCFPDADFNPALQARYNRLVDGLYDEIVDYITLHFHLSNRQDTEYWRAMRHDMIVPDRLQSYLDLWRTVLPEDEHLETRHFFTAANYTAALLGKRFYGDAALARAGLLDESVWRTYLTRFRAGMRQAIEAMPPHRALLENIRGQA